MQKIIFLDIDGTLCEPGMLPTQRTAEAISRARSRGNKVFLATGRNVPSIPKSVLNIGFDGVLASAGGYVVVGDTVLVDRHMPPELVAKARRIFAEHQIEYMLECGDGTYADCKTYRSAWAANLSYGSSEQKRLMLQLIDNIGLVPVSGYCGQPVYKICFIGSHRGKVEHAVAQLGGRFQTYIEQKWGSSAPMVNGETMAVGIDKGAAVEAVCRYYGAAAAETVVFGDSANDISMLRTAGTAVVMANAAGEVKRFADIVCPSCTDEGVYHTMVELGLA